MARKQHIHRAFTLVELLVVIGIIALLVSILLPALSKAKEAANTVKCAAQMKQIMTACIMYTTDNKGAFPTPPSIGETYPTIPSLAYYMDTATANSGVLRFDVGTLWPYISPGANKQSANAGVKPGPQVLKNIMNCPSDTESTRNVAWGGNHWLPRNFSYSWNVLIRYAVSGLPASDAATKINKVKSSSNKILLIEEAAPNDGVCWIAVVDPDDTPAYRHNRRGNYGFADGHIDTLDPTTMGYSKIQNESQRATIIDQKRVDYYFKLTR